MTEQDTRLRFVDEMESVLTYGHCATTKKSLDPDALAEDAYDSGWMYQDGVVCCPDCYEGED